MIGHDLGPAVRRHQRVPALLGFGEALVEVGVALGEVRGIARAQLGELLLDGLRNPPPVCRIEPVVRVSLRMHVTHRARQLSGGDVEDAHVQRGVQVAAAARLDGRVAALGDERRQPADLQLPSHGQQQLRAVQFEDEARFRLDEVRVLIPARERLHADLVAADLLGERREIFRRRHDLDRRRRMDRTAEDGAGHEQ